MVLETIKASEVHEGDEILVSEPHLGQFAIQIAHRVNGYTPESDPGIDRSTFAARIERVEHREGLFSFTDGVQLTLRTLDRGNDLHGIPDTFTARVSGGDLELLRAHTGWRHAAYESRLKGNGHGGRGGNGNN